MSEKSAWNYVVSSAPPFRRWRRKNHEISKSIVIGYFRFIVECNPESKEVFFCVQDVVLCNKLAQSHYVFGLIGIICSNHLGVLLLLFSGQ